MDNKSVSFAKKNYQHGKKTAKNESAEKHNEKHSENENRIIATLENIGTHLNA